MTTPDAGEGFGGGSISFGDVELVLNPDAIKVMLHSGGVIAAVAGKAEAMAAVANSSAIEPGADYAVTVVSAWPGSSRARANVWTRNHAARLDEAKHATLLKALASG